MAQLYLPKIKPGTAPTDKAVISCLKLPLHLMTSLGLDDQAFLHFKFLLYAL